MRTKLILLFAIVGGVLLIAAGASLVRSDRFHEWAWDATGEEDAWEAVKGVVALALLEASSSGLELAPDAPAEHLGATPYGVNTFLQLEADPENVRMSMAVMRDAGIGWARQQFPWEDIEIHARGDFEDRRHEPHRSAWDKYDRIVDAAGDHGVQLLVRLDDPPNWAYDTDEPVTHLGPPDDLEAYGDFVAAVVDRYCGKVRYYQIWNEPNIYPEWGDQDVNPAGYAELVSVAATRAREACDDVVIVSAALAPTTEAGGRNMSDLDYLEALYEAGWAEDFDVLAVNAFGLWTGPTDRRVSADRTNFSRAMLAREVQVRHGDEQKPIWITEMGWDSPPEDMAAPYGRVDEDTRARYTEAAYERMAEEWPWVGPGFLWFLRRPNWEWHDRPEGFFRIIEPDWTQMPTYQSLAGIGTRPPVLRRGRHLPDDVALQYAGPWSDVPDRGPVEQRVGSPGAELSFVMDGTGFRIELAAPLDDDDLPELFLVVDGETSTELPEAADERLTLERRDLEDGKHLVIMRVDGGEARLDELLVSAPDPESPMTAVWTLLKACLAGAVLLALAAAVLLWARTRSTDRA